MSESEVSRIRQQITLEYEAAQRGLSGLTYGTTKHAFITARMEHMGKLHEQLTTLVGPEQASKLVAEAWEGAQA